MGKRKSSSTAGGISKLRLVVPEPGELGPVPVYLASRLQPDNQAVNWAVRRSNKDVQVTGQLVRLLTTNHLCLMAAAGHFTAFL